MLNKSTVDFFIYSLNPAVAHEASKGFLQILGEGGKDSHARSCFVGMAYLFLPFQEAPILKQRAALSFWNGSLFPSPDSRSPCLGLVLWHFPSQYKQSWSFPDVVRGPPLLFLLNIIFLVIFYETLLQKQMVPSLEGRCGRKQVCGDPSQSFSSTLIPAYWSADLYDVLVYM